VASPGPHSRRIAWLSGKKKLDYRTTGQPQAFRLGFCLATINSIPVPVLDFRRKIPYTLGKERIKK
jgi:hypothetical protein